MRVIASPLCFALLGQVAQALKRVMGQRSFNAALKRLRHPNAGPKTLCAKCSTRWLHRKMSSNSPPNRFTQWHLKCCSQN